MHRIHDARHYNLERKVVSMLQMTESGVSTFGNFCQRLTLFGDFIISDNSKTGYIRAAIEASNGQIFQRTRN